ncbi:MAG: chemotaxis protein CheR [Bacteroidetes bacterium HGW-Bacteroidetes-18]|nr:MAG: chemotaxis protein CheR [Bacteroidetes bacterium HGW-Bacteroidetes-18]
MESTPQSDKKKVVSKKEIATKPSTKAAKETPKLKIALKNKSIPVSKKNANSFTVVAIGASAGGLEAISLLLQNLSPETGMAYIYVQHLSPDHESLLVPLLSKKTDMKVQDIDDIEKIMPNNVYVIPYNKEIEVIDGHIQLIPRPKNKSSNLSIDALFSSLSETHKENVIGIVLSGSATDGTRGLSEIKEAGGITFAQDDSAKFTSMPHSAIASGYVDFVLSPKEIATELNWMSKHDLVKRNQPKTLLKDKLDYNKIDLKKIFLILLKKKNVDFSHYKLNTIKRRMLRRMLIHKIDTLKQYADLLAKNDNELDLLFQDLLINVTEFFRDTEAFELLKKSVLPLLLKSKSQNETLRIWVAACATGEEVYSIAMLLHELQGNKTKHIPFQIFASDLSASAIDVARNGAYTKHQLKNVSPKRLQQFFTKSGNKFRISKSLRDVCVFAQHNILRDPPFSRMDFISCRNLLIYLDNTAQKKAISTFHYALNEGGCLMLGKSETIGTADELFTAVNKKFKIYARKKNSGVYKLPIITSRAVQSVATGKQRVVTVVPKRPTVTTHGNLGNVFDSVLLAHYMPASVIINHNMEILQFRGSTEMYLKNSPGKASLNILTMVLPEISFELRNAIHHAIKTKRTVNKSGIEITPEKIETAIQVVNLEVMPLKIEGEEPLLVVVFTSQQIDILQHAAKSGEKNTVAKDRRIKKLEEELVATRADMGSITHDQEALNEELQSANEEIVSSNEELQSLNEELETSKEEIESTNEELITSNHELLARNQMVEELYTYNEAILSTIHEPMLVLDKDIRIKSANKAFYKTFHVTEVESLGESLYKLGNNQWNIPRLRELLEEIIPKNNTFYNFEVAHEFPNIGHKIMLLNAHRIIKQSNNQELIVLTIVDYTEVRKLQTELQEKEKKILEKQLEADKQTWKLIEENNKRYDMMLMQSPFAFAIFKGKDMVINLANDSFKDIWGKGNHIEGKKLLQVLPEIKDGSLQIMIEKVFTTGISQQGYEFLVPIKRDGKLENVYLNFVFQPYKEADKTISGITMIAYEVTNQFVMKDALIKAKDLAEHKTQIAEDAMKAKQQFLSNMSHEIRTPMNAIIGFTKVVLKTGINEKQKEYLNAIKTSGDSLIVLINDILDLAKVDSGKMFFEQTPFKMSDSISAILQLFEIKIQENNTELIVTYDQKIPEVLLGDPVRLRQIILNLMSNAVKFTSGGKINASVRLLKEDKKKATLEFTITDTGIGIPSANLTTIFENFQQASTGTSKMYGGTGLGLAIAKKLVESQGGSIHAESKIDEGSTFSFIMSFQKTKAKVKENANIQFTSPETEIKNIKVLVAEDIALNQLLMKTLLDDFKFGCDIASNGREAIEKLKNNKYDIVLMDLQMPEMNGFEATSYIRNILNSNIPIIALTANVTTVDLAKCKAIGMNDYISKPVEEKLLYQKIVNLIKKATSAKSTEKKKEEIKEDNQEKENSKELKCTDLNYLKRITKSNPNLMMEMISLYLEQTPIILSAMNQGVNEKDYTLIYKAVHKLIPSFSIMGINVDFENKAKKIQRYAIKQECLEEIPDLILQIDKICVQACEELEEAFNEIKNIKNK